jgi:hypothetical protein
MSSPPLSNATLSRAGGGRDGCRAGHTLDVQARDHYGRLWAFLDEGVHPGAIVPGHSVVTGDDEDPVVARVLEVVERPGGRKVVMELVGDASELLDALTRTRLVAA